MTIDYYFGENKELYQYEPDYDDLFYTITQMFANIYKLHIEVAEEIIVDYELEDKCIDMYYEDLKEIYEKEAYQSWQSKNEKKNSTRDFVNLLNNEMKELKNGHKF